MCKKNFMNVFVWLCTVTLLLALTSKSQVIGKNGQMVDCRVYVFAPVCRGVAAKRVVYPPRISLQKIIREDLAENILDNYPPFPKKKPYF